MTNPRLYWLQTKHDEKVRRRNRARPIGELLCPERSDEQLQRVQRAVDAFVDETFREFCRVTGLSRGVVWVNSRSPTVVPGMRYAFEAKILKAARAVDPQCSRVGWSIR